MSAEAVRGTTAVALAALLSLGGCTASNGPTGAGRSRAALRGGIERVFAWGAGAQQLGLQPQRRERLASGVSALAIGSDGAVHLLDRINRRVVRVGAGGKLARVVAVAQDVEELALGADGTIAAFSPLRARVWLYRHGELAGAVSVPRTLRDIQRVAVGASQRVVVQTAMQERFALGSPHAPQTLGQVLHGKREGAFVLADGHAVQVRLVGGRAQLDVLARRADGRTRALRTLRVDDGTDTRRLLAARLVGVAGNVACVRLERDATAAGGTFVVARELRCVDGRSGALKLARALPAPGIYAPRRELAVGGADPARVALIVARRDGLHLWSWRLTADGGSR